MSILPLLYLGLLICHYFSSISFVNTFHFIMMCLPWVDTTAWYSEYHNIFQISQTVKSIQICIFSNMIHLDNHCSNFNVKFISWCPEIKRGRSSHWCVTKIRPKTAQSKHLQHGQFLVSFTPVSAELCCGHHPPIFSPFTSQSVGPIGSCLLWNSKSSCRKK